MWSLITSAVLCTSCLGDPQPPLAPRLGVPQPAVDQLISDGCARFQVRFDAGGQPVVEPVYNTNACQTNQLRLLSDTAAVFDAATGALRVAVVMENAGTAAVIPRVRLRFNADSVVRRDANGEVVPGVSDILGYQADSAGAAGRIAFWWYDQLLGAIGQPQVLMPGARTQRRWVEFRGTSWTAQIRLKLFATGAESPPVPAIAPDSLPRGLLSDSALVPDPDAPSLRYVRRVVSILFRPSATQAQRQAAISQIGGAVVGGIRIGGGDGYYLVRLLSDTSTMGPKLAVAALRLLPQVEEANVEYATARLLHYSPTDGTGWTKWALLPAAGVADTNWAMESVGGPLAWGCTTGSQAARIALVDRGFFVTTPTGADLDFRSNVNTALSVGFGFNPSGRAGAHGTRLAHIAAAVGDNHVGMTGIAWRADMRLYDFGAVANGDPSDSTISDIAILSAINHAAADGAQVISLSAAEMWTGIMGMPSNPVGIPAFQAMVDSTRSRMVRLLTRLANGSPARRPLLVLAAGNRELPTEWSRFPAVAADPTVGARVLVVGGSTSARRRWRHNGDIGSSFGPLVGVYAPAESVFSVDGNGTLGRATGTSDAAPFVAAVAGLLLSQDSALTAEELRDFIVRGAVESRLPMDEVPIANAYASLRLAAERPQTPLCGNRAWIAGNTISVQRGHQVEQIPAPGADSAYALEVAHGGRRITYTMHSGAKGSVIWTSGGWQAGPATPVPADSSGGTARSVLRFSHSGDTTLALILGATDSALVRVDLELQVGGLPVRAGSITLPGLLGPLGPGEPDRERVFVSGAYPMVGREALVAVNIQRATGIPLITSCPVPKPHNCQESGYWAYAWKPRHAILYRVHLDSPTLQADSLGLVPDSTIYDIGFAEDGQEKLVRIGRDSSYFDNIYNVSSNTSLACHATWSRPGTGAGPAAFALFDSSAARRGESVSGCLFDDAFNQQDGRATNAPRIRGIAPAMGNAGRVRASGTVRRASR